MPESKPKVAKDRKIVCKSNALARAQWDACSVWEGRIVALIAAQVASRKAAPVPRPAGEDEDYESERLVKYRLRIADLIGSDAGGRDYLDLERAVERLQSRIITIRDDDGNWEKYTLFYKTSFRRKSGLLTVSFTERLIPHYLALTRYIRYSLSEFMLLPSTYSQRMFEFLKSWSDRGQISVPLAELHDMLATSETMRSDFRQFRVHVLEKAQADLMACMKFDFEWDAVSQGRKVARIDFALHGPQIAAMRALKAERKGQKELKRASSKREREVSLFKVACSCRAGHGADCQGGFQDAEVCAMCLRFASHQLLLPVK